MAYEDVLNHLVVSGVRIGRTLHKIAQKDREIRLYLVQLGNSPHQPDVGHVAACGSLRVV